MALVLNPYTFNVIIDIYYYKINSKLPWLCYRILTLSIVNEAVNLRHKHYGKSSLVTESLHFQYYFVCKLCKK